MQSPPTTTNTDYVPSEPPSIDTSDLQTRLDELRALMNKDDPTDAVYACDAFNRDYPVSGQGWHVASHIALKISDIDGSLRAIDRALAIDPERPQWLLQKANCLNLAGRNEDARLLASKLAARLYPGAALSSAVGLLLVQLEMHEEAQILFAEAIKLEPDVGGHYYNLATVQRYLGMLKEAERNLDEAVRLDAKDTEAMALRSGIRTQTDENNHVEELAVALAKPALSPRQEVSLCHALAKELEDLCRYPESFTCLARGADKRRQHINYDIEEDLATLSQIADVFNSKALSTAAAGYVDAQPVFVVGMPRTGSTLVERILGSHSVVAAAGELTNFAVQLTTLTRDTSSARKRSELVRASAKLDFAKLGKAYVESCKHVARGHAHFVDKMPMNFLYAGLIHLALPKAKIICTERHPMDTCYAVYKTLFQGAYPYSYDLTELARYFVAYSELMQHWDEVLPGVIHYVSYESLVEEPRGEIQKLLDHCGLSWEEDCLNFHSSDGHSTTASATQVRQPLYRTSVGRWKNYETELKPLREILAGSGIDL